MYWTQRFCSVSTCLINSIESWFEIILLLFRQHRESGCIVTRLVKRRLCQIKIFYFLLVTIISIESRSTLQTAFSVYHKWFSDYRSIILENNLTKIPKMVYYTKFCLFQIACKSISQVCIRSSKVWTVFESQQSQCSAHVYVLANSMNLSMNYRRKLPLIEKQGRERLFIRKTSTYASSWIDHERKITTEYVVYLIRTRTKEKCSEL